MFQPYKPVLYFTLQTFKNNTIQILVWRLNKKIISTRFRPGWEYIGTSVEHRMELLLVFPQACGEFHTRWNIFRRALQNRIRYSASI